MFSPDRFDGGQEVTPKTAAEVPEKKFTEVELRERYEGPYRQEKAREFSQGRKNLSSQIKQQEADVVARHDSLKAFEVSVVNHETKGLQRLDDQYIRELSWVDENKNITANKKNLRGFFTKLKYKLIDDPIDGELSKIEKEKEELLQKVKANEDKKQLLKHRLDEKLLQIEQQQEEELTRKGLGLSESKKDLLDKVRKANQSSREAIKNTLASLEKGDLDISKLAQEANAIVVHTIPIEGWSMNNTAGNNQEVDTLSMSSHEKIAKVKELQPDISASVITAGERIPGQEVMYPFGLILGGTIMASYERDEGTIAVGDARRKKDGRQTLQSDTTQQFKKNASQVTPDAYSWNESIVHKPSIQGILIDDTRLGENMMKGDTVETWFQNQEEADEEVKKFGEEKTRMSWSTSDGRVKVTRSRDGLEKAISYANKEYPDLKVYIRKQDGIYDTNGQKVTATQIYSR